MPDRAAALGREDRVVVERVPGYNLALLLFAALLVAWSSFHLLVDDPR